MEIDEHGREVRRPHPPGEPDPDDLLGPVSDPGELGFPEFEHNQWTFEGRIERLGAFSRGMGRATGWRRVLGVTVALLIVVPVMIAGLIELVRLLLD